MCGIHGILSLRDVAPPDPAIHVKMAAVSSHRGPDDTGYYVGDGILLGMCRLSIIDLVGGHQPIPNENETLWVVCNGEVYNFRELRKTLVSEGHVFKTGSDSEVIVHLYEEYGDRFLERLDGMFAFALWDVRRRRLLIGRDRLGIKPLYYYQDPYRLVFASETKAILTVPGISIELDPVGLDQYLALGYTPTPYSILRGIRKLPPASYLVCEDGKVAIQRYWSASMKADPALSEEDWCELLRERLEEAVASQMVSDVPIGAFLSGGIDSSSVVAIMSRHSSQPVKTYSIGFTGGKASDYYNELPYAQKISRLFQTDHREIVVQPNAAELLPKLLWHMDEPIADSAFLTTYLVAEFARQDVKVILSGVGGDELFGGYHRYLGEYYAKYYNILPKWLRRGILHPLCRHLPSDRHSPLMDFFRLARAFVLSSELPFEERYRTYVEVFNQPTRAALLDGAVEHQVDALACAFDNAPGDDALNRLLEVDLLTQLPDDLLMLTDKMTMATSLECRVPLLDHRLVELAASLPSSIKVRGRELKYVFKRALRGLLPDEILHRKKRGFGAPMGAWFNGQLAPLKKSLLSRESIGRRGFLNWDVMQDTLNQSNRTDHTDQLLSLIHFEVWCRLYLDGRTPVDVSEELVSELRR